MFKDYIGRSDLHEISGTVWILCSRGLWLNFMQSQELNSLLRRVLPSQGYALPFSLPTVLHMLLIPYYVWPLFMSYYSQATNWGSSLNGLYGTIFHWETVKLSPGVHSCLNFLDDIFHYHIESPHQCSTYPKPEKTFFFAANLSEDNECCNVYHTCT